jgi:oligopeptide transport system permease protein
MKNWAAVGSAAVVILLILAALLAPYLWAKNAITPDLGNTLGAPSGDHWFGTDAEGRDLYTRMLLGLRLPLIISFIGTGLTVIIGLALGLAAGYFGGWIDSILSRFTDLMFAFPSFLLAFILIDVYGSTFDNLYPGGVGRALILIVVFAVVSWPPLYRFVRSLALTLKEQQFIEAARTVGTSNIKMIWRHLAPNVYGLVLVQAALTVAFIIGTEAVLSILGLGVNEPTPDLGRMLYDGYGYMDAVAWGVFFPCLFLTILIVAFTFIGDGIRDAVDPRSTR